MVAYVSPPIVFAHVSKAGAMADFTYWKGESYFPEHIIVLRYRIEKRNRKTRTILTETGKPLVKTVLLKDGRTVEQVQREIIYPKHWRLSAHIIPADNIKYYEQMTNNFYVFMNNDTSNPIVEIKGHNAPYRRYFSR